MNSAIDMPVALRIFETLSVDGQRSRPSAATRFDGLKVVGSSPARRASPDVVRLYRLATSSIAAQMRSCDSTRPLRAVALFVDRNIYLNDLSPLGAACRVPISTAHQSAATRAFAKSRGPDADSTYPRSP